VETAATHEGWAHCYARYEILKGREHWASLANAMIRLIDRIRADASFPETVHVVSHAWLRIGPPSDGPHYRPAVWVGWRKPNYYWIGVGSFGTHNRVTVSADKVVPMLKRYLHNLHRLDPAYTHYAELPAPASDPWSREEVEARYGALNIGPFVNALAEDIGGQALDIRGYVEQLHEAVKGLDQIHGADEAINAIMTRLERITTLLTLSAERWNTANDDTQVAPAVEASPDEPAPIEDPSRTPATLTSALDAEMLARFGKISRAAALELANRARDERARGDSHPNGRHYNSHLNNEESA
jgi:hypothetical protein